MSVLVDCVKSTALKLHRRKFENDGGRHQLQTPAAVNNVEYATNQLGATPMQPTVQNWYAWNFVEFMRIQTGVVWVVRPW